MDYNTNQILGTKTNYLHVPVRELARPRYTEKYNYCDVSSTNGKCFA